MKVIKTEFLFLTFSHEVGGEIVDLRAMIKSELVHAVARRGKDLDLL